MEIELTCVDTRHNQDAVHEFALSSPSRVLSVAGAGRPIQAGWTENPITRMVDGVKRDIGINLLTFNTDNIKRNIQDRYDRSQNEPGALILPANTSDQLLHHLVSEERIAKRSGAKRARVALARKSARSRFTRRRCGH